MGEWAEFEAIREDQERALSFTNFEKILRKFLLGEENEQKTTLVKRRREG